MFFQKASEPFVIDRVWQRAERQGRRFALARPAGKPYPFATKKLRQLREKVIR